MSLILLDLIDDILLKSLYNVVFLYVLFLTISYISLSLYSYKNDLAQLTKSYLKSISNSSFLILVNNSIRFLIINKSLLLVKSSSFKMVNGIPQYSNTFL